ncbi:hypothetical protein C4573_02175 [Candidatus Woesearchaeota archaeon]|nr:MAG: hypothetical protein C4573_02175 [Candidatus Woesearchaeota archaeon]
MREMEREDLTYFVNKYCNIILENGFTYTGILKKINDNTIVFDDRFQGLKIFDLSIITGIGEAGEKNDRR